jgi:hypothetical protein
MSDNAASSAWRCCGVGHCVLAKQNNHIYRPGSPPRSYRKL